MFVAIEKNVFVNLPTQKRAYIIPVSGSNSTIVFDTKWLAASMEKNPVSDILQLPGSSGAAAHKLKLSHVLC